MSQPPEVFEVGDRVVYVGFRRRIYGTVTGFKLESMKNGGKILEVRVYTIATEGGGSATKPGYYLQRAE
jgi:hypothetical protein